MTTQKIDVLAILDHAATRTPTLTLGSQIHDARAAVAELIEAHRDVIDSQYGLAMARYNGAHSGLQAEDVMRAELRLSAALARIGGEA